MVCNILNLSPLSPRTGYHYPSRTKHRSPNFANPSFIEGSQGKGEQEATCPKQACNSWRVTRTKAEGSVTYHYREIGVGREHIHQEKQGYTLRKPPSKRGRKGENAKEQQHKNWSQQLLYLMSFVLKHTDRGDNWFYVSNTANCIIRTGQSFWCNLSRNKGTSKTKRSGQHQRELQLSHTAKTLIYVQALHTRHNNRVKSFNNVHINVSTRKKLSRYKITNVYNTC